MVAFSFPWAADAARIPASVSDGYGGSYPLVKGWMDGQEGKHGGRAPHVAICFRNIAPPKESAVADTPQLQEILNNHQQTIQKIAGMIEAQRFMIEDLYAHIYSDAALFAHHAEALKQLPTHGAAPGTAPELLELRAAARQEHLVRALDSAAARIKRRNQ